MSSLPSDLQRALDDLDAADREADALVSGLSDEQLHWQPDGGRGWSIAQCLEHLATANTVYGEPMRRAIDAARAAGWTRKAPSRPGIFGAWFIRSLEPPVKLRQRAPGKIRPSSGLPREEVLRRYRDAHALVRGLIRDAAAIDVNRATFQNPFLPLIRVKIATAFGVISAHDRRHLWQAGRVRARADFPAAPAARS
jgi:hypothetical protein